MADYRIARPELLSDRPCDGNYGQIESNLSGDHFEAHGLEFETADDDDSLMASLLEILNASPESLTRVRGRLKCGTYIGIIKKLEES